MEVPAQMVAIRAGDVPGSLAVSAQFVGLWLSADGLLVRARSRVRSEAPVREQPAVSELAMAKEWPWQKQSFAHARFRHAWLCVQVRSGQVLSWVGKAELSVQWRAVTNQSPGRIRRMRANLRTQSV